MPASPSASVFINCPFDQEYQPIFEAIVFCVAACGFVPRCTLELTDTAEVRIENIYRLISECNHSIHDISRTEVQDQSYRLPRFNMPLELGIFLGAKRFGGRSSRRRLRRFVTSAIGCSLRRAKLRFLAARRFGRITSSSEESCLRLTKKHNSIRRN